MKRYVLAAAFAASAAMCAHAETISFNSASQGMLFGPTYSEGGFTLTGTGFQFPQSDGWAFSTYANDGTLTFNYKGPTYTLTKDGGGAFDFTSFDLGNLNSDNFGGTLQVGLNGSTPVSFAIPTTDALTTFNLNAKNVTSVAFSYLPGEDANNTLNSYARIDNLVVSPGISAVPEPASWAMMIGGIAFVGGVIRRRYRTSETMFTAKVRSVSYGG